MKRELRELIICMTDAYKLFHRQMYPNNTITVYSNGTPRSSTHYKGKNKDEVIVFGTQRAARVLDDKFAEFFALPEQEVVNFCKEQLSSFTGTDYDVNHILYLHRLQKLPLIIKSLPEGTKCPIKVPYMTFYNTDPKCFWLTNYLESFISCEIWPLITNATIAAEYKMIFDKWAMKTVGNTDFVGFQGHDFSMRGMFGGDAARMSGLAHLTSFCGSDTVPSYLDAQYYYDSGQNDFANGHIVATSVPATEHSVQCAHFNPEDGNELAYLDAILEAFPTGIVSIVCDGYDFWKFITEVIPARKDAIMTRDGKVVVRPDTGNPADIMCGTNVLDMTSQYAEYEFKGAIECLWDIFAGTETETGYRLLDEHIGLIYGDSISLELAEDVCTRLAKKDFASINWVAGIGSYTYQFNTRDSHGQAIKATYVEFAIKKLSGISTTGKEIFKDPKTGDGMKKSAKGLLAVVYDKEELKKDNYVLKLEDQITWGFEKTNNLLQTILEDGELKNATTLMEIRDRIAGKVLETETV